MVKPLHLLIVEDVESDASLVIRHLRHEYPDIVHERVLSAADMKEALERKPWDIIICDYRLPQFDAPSALKLLQETDLDIPFIVVSGTIGEESAVAIMKAGAQDYIMKDNLTRLVPAIKREIRDAAVRVDRRRSGMELQVALQRLRFHAENSPLAMIEFDSNYRITAWSKRAEVIFGWSAKELVGRNISEIKWVYEEDVENIEALSSEMFSGKNLSNISVNRNYRKDGKVITCEWYNSALLDENGNLVSVHSLVLDVTERIRTETELLRAKEQAEESDRLKTAFLANMSHEIRTPMNSIIGFSEFLDDETLSPYDRKEFIRVIQYNGRHLLDIINNLVDIARIDSQQVTLTRHVFNLNQLLDHLYSTFEGARNQKRKSEISLRLEKGLNEENSYLLADEEKLRKILTNLLDNSLKFTSAGEIVFGYHLEGEKLKFFVRDTGRGIAKEKQSVVFEKFRQEEESNTRYFGGFGLGLSISKGLVHLMEGEIWLVSEQGKGSEIFFTIPYSSPVEKISTKKPGYEKISHELRNKTILVVDDVDANIDLIQLSFLKSGVMILSASNGKLAIETLHHHPETNLVLMDMQMPVMDGFEATNEILKLQPDIPVIAVTAYVSAEDKQRCYEVGCVDFLAKPFDKEELFRVVQKYMK